MKERKKCLVIVESPAKAKTIENYLGKDYRVLATRGHVRDLVNKEGSVDFNNNFEMKWTATVQNAKYMREIYDACKKCDAVVLATDPDREGEAISWHVLEMLKKKKMLSGEDKKATTTTTSSNGSSSSKSKSKHVSRVTFTEVTKNAVLEAFGKPREIDLRLVDAYLARRALDYLYGFYVERRALEKVTERDQFVGWKSAIGGVEISRGERNGSRGVRSETVLVGPGDFRRGKQSRQERVRTQSCSVSKGRKFQSLQSKAMRTRQKWCDASKIRARGW